MPQAIRPAGCAHFVSILFEYGFILCIVSACSVLVNVIQFTLDAISGRSMQCESRQHKCFPHSRLCCCCCCSCNTQINLMRHQAMQWSSFCSDTVHVRICSASRVSNNVAMITSVADRHRSHAHDKHASVLPFYFLHATERRRRRWR